MKMTRSCSLSTLGAEGAQKQQAGLKEHSPEPHSPPEVPLEVSAMSSTDLSKCRKVLGKAISNTRKAGPSCVYNVMSSI